MVHYATDACAIGVVRALFRSPIGDGHRSSGRQKEILHVPNDLWNQRGTRNVERYLDKLNQDYWYGSREAARSFCRMHTSAEDLRCGRALSTSPPRLKT